MTVVERIARWADKLRDISAMGSHFAENPYDKENYAVIQEIALGMMALAGGDEIADLEPIRDTVLSRPTPFSVGDGAVIDDNGRLLLIQRADNGLWAMPGGALEVNETPAEGVLREVLEETGVAAEAVTLVGVHDSRLNGTTSRFHLYHFLFLCRPTGTTAVAPTHPQETLAMGWFAQDELPVDLDPGHATRIPEAFRVWQGDWRPYFD